jgi:hypothetical protein
MTRTWLAAVVVAAGLVAGGEARAQALGAPMTVDAVSVAQNGISVTGVPVGAQAAVTVQVRYDFATSDAIKVAALEECHRMLLLALGKPGQYRFRGGTNLCEVSLAAP